MAWNGFGEFFKQKRLELGVSLRQFCLGNDFDPGNISKLERGRLAPPHDHDVLERYATALHISEGTPEWFNLFDLASAATGRIPVELLSDEGVVAKLPLLFRAIREAPTKDGDIDKLVEIVRRS